MFPKTLALLLMIVGFCLLGGSPLSAQESGISLPALEPINPNNVAQLELLAQLGTGTLSDAFAWSPTTAELAVGGTTGIWTYNTHHFSRPPHFIPTRGYVNQIGYSPDGNRIAYVAQDTVYVLGRATEGSIAEFEKASLFAFQPAGELLAIARDEFVPDEQAEMGGYWLSKIDLWNLKTQETVQSLPISSGWTTATFVNLGFSPDGSLLAVSWTSEEYSTCGERRVALEWWPVQDALKLSEEALTASDTPRNVLPDAYEFVFHPTRNQLATIQWDTLRYQPSDRINYYDSLTNEAPPHELGGWVKTVTANSETYGAEELITALTFKPDGTTLAAVMFPKVIRFLNAQSGEIQQEWRLETPIDNLAYSPDGHLLAASHQGQIWVWDESGNRQALLGIPSTQQSGGVNRSGTAMFTRDSKNQLHIWVIEQQTVYETDMPESYRSAEVRFTPHPDRLVFYPTEQKKLVIWDYRSHQQTRLNGEQLREDWRNVDFSPDGNWIALQKTTEKIEIYSTTTGELRATLAASFQNRVQLRFSPDGQQLVTAQYFDTGDKHTAYAEVKQWDSSTGELIRTYGTFRGTDPTGQYYRGEVSVQFNLDGTKVAVSNTYYEKASEDWSERHYVINIYDASSGERLFNHEHTDGDSGLLSPDFSLYAADFGDWSSVVIYLFDTATDGVRSENQKYIYSSLAGGVRKFGPDHQQLLVSFGTYTNCGGDYRAVGLYDTQTLETVTEVNLPSKAGGWGTEDIIFSPSGDLLLVSTEYWGEIINTQSGEELAYLQTLDNSDLYFNQDATLLIAVRRDGTITLWGVPQ